MGETIGADELLSFRFQIYHTGDNKTETKEYISTNFKWEEISTRNN